MAEHTTKKVLLCDVGGVIAQDTYNDLLSRLLLSPTITTITTTTTIGDNDGRVGYATDDETFKTIMQCATNSWALYKIGTYNEDVFFQNVVQNCTLTQELQKRGYLKEDNTCETSEVVSFLKRELRDHHFKLFDSVVDMLVDLKKQYSHREDIIFAVLSNHSLEWLPELFNLYSDRLHYLFSNADIVYNSAAIKLAKPDPLAFEHVKQDLANRFKSDGKMRILFIDDKLANINAAKQSGMETYQFNALKQQASELRQVIEQFFGSPEP